MAHQWVAFCDQKPENCTRIIAHRQIGPHSYVDVMTYVEEPDSGIKPLVDTQHIRHWMPLPDAPAESRQDEPDTGTLDIGHASA